jgi:5-methylcytosine-specific restriction enzyme subunit McrC
MPLPLTLFEHEYKNFDWTDRDCAKLEQLHLTLGTEALRATVRHGRKVIQAAQHVGVIRLGNRTIQILPKIYKVRESTGETTRAREATHNLLYLLAYAGQLPVREHSLAPLLKRGKDWFEILTRLFASHLLEEWQRGAYRNYQTVEDELPVLKGKWRIADQLRRPLNQHRFFVAYDEFTADNQLNRIFRFVVERLWRLTRDGGNRQRLGELRQWMEEVRLMPHVTVTDANPSILTRLNQRYRSLLNLARLFLDAGSLQMAADDFTTFSFVFDMNQLFEAFIINFIRRHRAEIFQAAPELQNCDLMPQAHGASLYLAKKDDQRSVFLLKPDMAFRNEAKQFPLLLDTKYKRLNADDVKLGVSQADFYQMYAYARRYDCPRVLLLYPQTTEMAGRLRVRFPLQASDKVIEAATVNMHIALSNPSDKQGLIDELKLILGGSNGD